MERETQLLESEGTLPFSAYLTIWLFELGVESKLALFLFSFSLELAPINEAAWFRLADCVHDFQKPPHNASQCGWNTASG